MNKLNHRLLAWNYGKSLPHKYLKPLYMLAAFCWTVILSIDFSHIFSRVIQSTRITSSLSIRSSLVLLINEESLDTWRVNILSLFFTIVSIVDRATPYALAISPICCPASWSRIIPNFYFIVTDAEDLVLAEGIWDVVVVSSSIFWRKVHHHVILQCKRLMKGESVRHCDITSATTPSVIGYAKLSK